MIVKAFSKINLAIDVLSKREDGYHDIDIVSVPLELHDSLEVEEYPSRFGTYVTCDDTNIVCDESNLVYKAYREMKHKYGFNSGLRIQIYKRIPLQAGLAGGSADAAAVINALNKMKKLKMTDEEKISIASPIGSDVPYCLFNKPSRVEGCGEKITYIKVKNPYYVLLVKPKQGLSTKTVYEAQDKIKGERPDIDKLIKGLETDDESLILEGMKNGLQNAAISLVPEIDSIICDIKARGFNLTMMSGSGTTVFTLSHDLKKLQALSKVYEENYDVFLTKMLK